MCEGSDTLVCGASRQIHRFGPADSVGGAASFAVGFEHSGVHQLFEQPGDVAWMNPGNLLKAAVAYETFNLGRGQGQSGIGTQPVESGPKSRPEGFQNVLRQQAYRPQPQEGVFEFGVFHQLGRTVVVGFPIGHDAGNSGTGFFPQADEREHVLQVPVAAVAFPARQGFLDGNPHSSGIPELEIV